VLYGITFFPTNPTVNRSLTNTQTFETRIEIWKIAANLLPKSWLFPFWGGGTGEFKLLISDILPYQEFYKFLAIEYKWQPADQIKKTIVLTAPSMPKREKAFIFFYKDRSQEFTKITLDRAHNFFLDKAFSVGLIGAILWMIFYIYPIYAYFRLKPYQKTFEQQTLTMALLALQMYYIFWFSVMQVEPIHVVVALMAWVGIERAKAIPDPQQKSAVPLENTAPTLNA
jgi:O-antigen ligase